MQLLKHSAVGRFVLALILTGLIQRYSGTQTAGAAQPPTDQRQRWTTSKIKGSPEPPSPYALERVFSNIKLQRPTEMIYLAVADRWVVTELRGRVIAFDQHGESETALLDLGKHTGKRCRTLGIAFAPDFPARPYCYIAWSSEIGKPDGTRLSRFTVTDTQSLQIDPDSGQTLMRWSNIDHFGGCIKFGTDGYLYLAIGDGQPPSPPDPDGTGQDIGDLRSSILRIDVSTPGSQETHADATKLPYRIPADNPFVNAPGARGEVWAFGVRNPWKMCFHPTTGQLWAGDVGWETTEMVSIIKRGNNYGWSIKEGSQTVKPNGKRSSIPITPPIFEHDHVESRSITGGYFWNAGRIAALRDAYIYGDWMTGKIWGLKHDGQKVTWQQELVDTPLQIVSFGLAPDGEVLVVGYDGTIHRLIPNPDVLTKLAVDFPKRLSETGLFTNTEDQTSATGVVEYSINAHHWADGTTSRQWFAIPGEGQLSLFERSNWEVGQNKGHFSFPEDSVLAKTISVLTNVEDPASTRKLETQILHRRHDDWYAYNYIWNEDQTDAVLQPDAPAWTELSISDPTAPFTGGVRRQTWLHASRGQCMLCHIWSAGSVHGFKVGQLNRPHVGESVNQLDKFFRQGILKTKINQQPAYVSPTDAAASLEARARQYLDLNCAHCHRTAGGGMAGFVLQRSVSLEGMKAIDHRAIQGSFGIANPMVIAAGDPGRSTLLYRIAKSGPGHMPHFGTNMIDQQGVELIHDWIKSLPQSLPDSTTNSGTYSQILQAIDVLVEVARSNGKTNGEIETTVDTLLSKTTSALALAIRCGRSGDDAVAGHLLECICKKAATAKPEIRDLFERYFPEQLKKKRLGQNFDSASLLAKAASDGNVERGRELFLESPLNCRQCHQAQGQGIAVGPTFDGIGSLRTVEQLLESIRNPSALVEQKYQSYIVLTEDGDIITGVKAAETGNVITMVDSQGKTHHVDTDSIEGIKPAEKSVMPAGLIDDLTETEACDLLAWLSSLKGNLSVR